MKSNVGKVTAKLAAEMRLRNEAAGIAVENNIKKKIRDYGLIDTGRMINSITHDSDVSQAVIGTNVEYAPFQNNGTRTIPPHHFMENGLIESKPELIAIYSAGIRL